MRPGWIL
jgi:signal transduction histidine kinase